MDSDRKYRQNGYMDSGESKKLSRGPVQTARPASSLGRDRPPSPRLVQHVAASRCYNCATTLPPKPTSPAAAQSATPNYTAANRCSHFEPSTRFQCLEADPGAHPREG